MKPSANLPECSWGCKILPRENGIWSGFAIWNYTGGFSYLKNGRKVARRRINQTELFYASIEVLRMLKKRNAPILAAMYRDVKRGERVGRRA